MILKRARMTYLILGSPGTPMLGCERDIPR